jgi:ABC-type antimicrobial peptide transport system permease subunit
MINETFAKKYFSGVDPDTQRLLIARFTRGTVTPQPVAWQVVGVYGDVRYNGTLRSEGLPEIALPFYQNPFPVGVFSVRTAGDPATMTSSIAAAVQSLDPDLPLDQVRTMDQVVDESLAGDRFSTVLFAAFAGVALLLAAIGIYSVMSFVVSQRTHEIGLRMALGAGNGQVLLLFLREGMLQALCGLVLGLVGTYFVGRAMKSVLYGISAVDPVAFGAVAFALLISALFACYLPARRAARVDPLVALRYE